MDKVYYIVEADETDDPYPRVMRVNRIGHRSQVGQYRNGQAAREVAEFLNGRACEETR